MIRETSPMPIMDFIQYGSMAVVFQSDCVKCMDHNHSPAYAISFGVIVSINSLIFFLCSKLSVNSEIMAALILIGFVIIFFSVVCGSYFEYAAAWKDHHSTPKGSH